jgi:hypothetical protein
MIGIVILDRLRQARQAFVVAHRGYVARNDRRHRPQEIGLEVWHEVNLSGIRRGPASSVNESI